MELDLANRPRSRQTSSNSTAPSASSDVWSMNCRAGAWGGSGASGSRTSSRTSIWSDEGKTIAPPRQSGDEWDGGDVSMLAEAGERPLIELESDAGGGESVDMGAGAVHPSCIVGDMRGGGGTGGEEMTPAEKLKVLLREMNAEVKETRVASPVKRMRDLPPSTIPPTGSGKGQRDLMDDYSSTAASDSGAGLRESTKGRRSAWRDRRIGSGASGSRTTTSDERAAEENQVAGLSSPRKASGHEAVYDEEDEDDSPPTPPPRITNPYLYNRKPSRRSPTPPIQQSSPGKAGRVPTRVEVLNASASRSPAPPPSPPQGRSALESFIASHPGPSTYRQPDLSRTSISSQGSSRKGKERAVPSASTSSVHSSPRHLRASSASSSIHEHTATPPSRTPRARSLVAASAKTPRRFDVESPPDDEDDFAAALEGLEVPGEVELDIDEGMSSRLEIMKALESESEAEAEQESFASPHSAQGRSPAKSPRQRRSREGSRDTTLQPPPTRHSRGPSEESLPALPEPDASESDDSQIDTLSSRRASLFRSTSKSPKTSLSPLQSGRTPKEPRQASQSPFKLSPARTPPGQPRTPPTASLRHSSNTAPRGSPARLAVQEPEEEEEMGELEDEAPYGAEESWKDAASSFARPSSSSSSLAGASALPPAARRETPQRSSGNTTLSGQPTPHPPGFLASTPIKLGVRFSPLRKHDGEWSVSLASASIEEDSVHRLKVSPIRHRPSPVGAPLASMAARTSRVGAVAAQEEDDEEVGNTSFTARISSLGRSLVRPKTLPRPSRTLAEASTSLNQAAERSLLAQEKLEHSQTAFLSALSSLSFSGSTAVSAAKQTWKWSTYAYWIALELLLCWAVFRVTLDYAAQVYPHDPWSPYSTGGQGLVVPQSSALSGFLVSHRGSANFFDLLERLRLWERLEAAGWMGDRVVGGGERWREGVRMFGGVPT